MIRVTALALVAGLTSAGAPLAAQMSSPRLFVEGRGGVAVPTFDIADVAKTGAALGGTVGYMVTPRIALFGEFDYGMHKDKATGDADIRTLHYMAKVGYSLTGPRERGWEAMVNLGAGAVGFDVEGAASTFTYPAINAGAKIAYNVNRSLAVVLSPQGDIAFGDEAEIGTNNAWVWPITIGIRGRF
ncbi:MAG TPA: outer membrane beta-barrel protein [Gemmatimonadales bacterium]|nr:outer membrane beta-barrel protein [Gemmatimonadales bacterium]